MQLVYIASTLYITVTKVSEARISERLYNII
jgi:hypothetical protein